MWHYRLFYVYKCVIWCFFLCLGVYSNFPITSRLKRKKKSIQVFKYFRRCLEALLSAADKISLKKRGWIVCVKHKESLNKIEYEIERSFGHKCIKWSHRVIFQSIFARMHSIFRLLGKIVTFSLKYIKGCIMFLSICRYVEWRIITKSHTLHSNAYSHTNSYVLCIMFCWLLL